MPRRSATRRPLVTPIRPWIATLNGFGCWVLLDELGNDPLAHPDPLERCYNVHIAARAKTLRAALDKIARRYEVFESPYRRDDEMVRMAWGEIIATKPPLEEVTKILDRRGQSELDLAA